MILLPWPTKTSTGLPNVYYFPQQKLEYLLCKMRFVFENGLVTQLSIRVSRNKNRQKNTHVGLERTLNTFQHGGRMCRLSKHGNYTWTTDELRPFRVYPCQRWRKFHLLNATLAWMQCGMSQNEVLMPNYDASNGEQATRCHNVAVRGRKFSIPAQGRSKTLQLNIKMMNFSKTSRRKRSSRGRTERYNSGPNRGTGERSCVKGNTTQENGPQNSCVRDILL